MTRSLPLLFGLFLAIAPVHATTSLDDCRTHVRERPDDLESYRCFWSVARNQRLWDDARRALEGHLALDPSNHAARLYLGAIEADLGNDRAEALYREAVAGFDETRDPVGIVYSRLGLCRLLRGTGRVDEAVTELRRAEEAAIESGHASLIARVRNQQASHLFAQADFGRALSVLREAESLAFPDGPSDLQTFILSRLGYAYWVQGRYRKAIDAYEREAEILERTGDSYQMASPRFNIALLGGRLLANDQMEIEEYLRLVEEAVELSARVGHREIEVRSRLLLAQELEGEAALEHGARALDIAGRIGTRRTRRQALITLGQTLWKADPSRRHEALSLVDEAVADARAEGSRTGLARATLARAVLVHDAGERSAWIGDYLGAIDLIEQIRNLQPESTVRARVFSQWAFAYLRFSGLLLQQLTTSPDPDGDLDLAFRTIERMRARVLIDEIDAAGAHQAVLEPTPSRDRRGVVLEEIARVQQRLMDAALPDEERSSVLATLERLEIEEGVLRDEIAREDPSFARLWSPAIPAVDQIRGLLDSDQAVLSFQLSTREASARGTNEGGSWVIVITRDEAFALPLPERPVVEDRVALFMGLLPGLGSPEEGAARRLYDDLLANALADLPFSVTRLIVIPDGCLNRIPFGALRDRTGVPLASTHEISYAPSATLWAHWKGRDRQRTEAALALSLADPELAAVLAAEDRRESDPWLSGLSLGRLPHARREARELRRNLAAGSVVRAGDDASERFLKHSDLGKFEIVHFASHAIVDPDHPDRSAVLLARGAPDEDGLLQIREIVDLDLDGKTVILSGCRSASGETVAGEGVLGLSRGFFQAGAHAVIGSLWPLRDDDAASLMGEFSKEVARGGSLAGALAAAQRTAIDAGTPTGAWAGWVVLGDGEIVPVPGGVARIGGVREAIVWALAALVMTAALVAVYLSLRRIFLR